jgi:hypothetical protein
VAAAVVASGCLLHVDHVSDAGAVFREAREQAAEARTRGGAPRVLGLLAYDADDGELVRLEVPIDLARRTCEKEGGFGVTLGGKHERMARRLRHRWRWEDVGDAGPGVLLEVHDAGERVLIWLR